MAFSAFKTGQGKGKIGVLKTIVIDAGHGGKDPGCNGAFAKEKDVSLSVALKLGKLIEANFKDVKVIYTRTTDIFVELEERAMIANKAKADLFISIHCNAAGKVVKYKDPKTKKIRVKMRKNKKGKYVPVETTNPLPFGSETYVMGLKNEEGKMKVATRENSVIYLEDDYEKKYEGFDPDSEESYIIMSNYTSAYVIQSATLGLKIQEEYLKKAGRVDKGVHRQSIWVLWRTAMPSILTEIGYLTNPLEEQFLASEKGQDYLSKAIFRGLRKYKDEVEGTKKTYDDDLENQEPLENENIKAGNLPGQKAKDEDDDDGDSIEVKKDTTELKMKDDNKGLIKLETKNDDPGKEIKMQDENKGMIALFDSTKIDPKASDTKTIEIKSDVINKTKRIADSTAKVNKAKTDSIHKAKAKSDSLIKVNKVKTDSLNKIKAKWKLDSIAAAKSDKNNSIEAKTEVVFKVQFASSEVPLNLKDPKFAAIKNGAYYKVKTTLKYTSGNFTNTADASAHQATLKQNGFSDCFVVAFKNGERIDINEAKRLIEQK